MSNPPPAKIEEHPSLLKAGGWVAVAGCLIFAASILIADFVVPGHDWMADTISDLGAGKYEYIVDIGIYAFSAALIAVALLAAHVHLGGYGWSLGMVLNAVLGLIVFLIGARNEYGDHDQDGTVIHIYLVYAVGVMLALAPWLMSKGAARAAPVYGKILVGISLVWVVSAPVFFVLPSSVDGIYERYLGLIAFAYVATLAVLFIRRGRQLSA